MNNGRIGISGSVLFAVNSDELRPEGRQLLKSLVHPLHVYLGERNEMLMVSGFTDDKPVRDGNQPLRGQPGAVGAARVDGDPRADRGRHAVRRRCSPRPSAPSSRWRRTPSEKGRAQNRRVEMAPVPRTTKP